jgi:hypothetical protein
MCHRPLGGDDLMDPFWLFETRTCWRHYDIQRVSLKQTITEFQYLSFITSPGSSCFKFN